ncbi:MAG: methyl-accepting chemotaxis protein, partial [Anaerocolumna sp.]|nr:methyl-accepting chemotaxis protein [Anaerocolumna sp.]
MINKLGNIQSEKRLMIKGKVPENKIIPIKLKLIIICILFAIIPLIIVNTISLAISKKALRQTSQTLTAELVRQVSLNVEAFVDVVDSNITQFVVGGLTQDNLISNYSSEDQLEKFFAATEIQNKLTYIQTIDRNINSTALIFNDVEVLGKITDVTKEDLLTIKELAIENQSIWIKGLGKATDKLFFIKQVAASSKNVKCTIVVHVNLERIIQTMSDINLLENSRLYITDYSGKMIYSKDKSKTNADKVIWDTLDKKIQFGTTFIQNTLVTYSVLPNGWYVIAEIPERSLTSQLDATDITVWILILVLGVVAIIVGSIFASGVSNPIMKLMKL